MLVFYLMFESNFKDNHLTNKTQNALDFLYYTVLFLLHFSKTISNTVYSTTKINHFGKTIKTQKQAK